MTSVDKKGRNTDVQNWATVKSRANILKHRVYDIMKNVYVHKVITQKHAAHHVHKRKN